MAGECSNVILPFCHIVLIPKPGKCLKGNQEAHLLFRNIDIKLLNRILTE